MRYGVFENKQLAIGNWQLARKPNPFHFATLCRPDRWKEKTRLKLTPIGAPKKTGKEGSTSFRQAFRIAVWFLFSTKAHGGWGIWLKDAGRGTQKRLPKSPELPKLAI